MKRPKLPNVPADVAWDIVAGTGFLLLAAGLFWTAAWLGCVVTGTAMLAAGLMGARIWAGSLRRPGPAEPGGRGVVWGGR